MEIWSNGPWSGTSSRVSFVVYSRPVNLKSNEREGSGMSGTTRHRLIAVGREEKLG